MPLISFLKPVHYRLVELYRRVKNQEIRIMYSREKLERLLRQAKVTTQSIQKVSQWMLSYRQHLPEMVTLWSDLIREGDAEHQIVYLYVANDAMQVGVRKFGRHIAAAFEKDLVDIVQLVMRDGEEKVKRCAIKIVGIWKERGVVTPPLLAMLENVCAGKPPAEEVPEADGKDDERRAKLLQEMTSDATVERVLEDMPEVVESSATTQMATHLQDLVNATISADMLSDRMFQLESSISVFHHACGEQDEEDEVVVVGEENDRTFPTAGGIAWSKMDQQVYDLDVENSRGHVDQYRTNLMDQATKRDTLIKELRALETRDLFSFPPEATTQEEADYQERTLEKLYSIACEAEKIEMKQLEEQRAEFRAKQESMAASASDPLYSAHHPTEEPYRPITPTSSSRGRSDSGNSHLGHRRSSYQHDQPHQRSLRRHSSASAVTDRGFMDDRHNDHHRYGGHYDRYSGSNDRYIDSPSTSKRPKLHHSYSMESQNVQWQEASRYSPRGEVPPYAVMEREQPAYSPRDNRYSPRDHYQPPPPRQGRRSRWDSMPEERYNSHYEDRRW
ncbi:hypothetical protein L917_15150 [Phytophthora nicotianae]|uniref:CID domain-containing protein n=1 Tax=Phytophthora nicotianae TaxID=4792 RepID=W2KLM1_PHYNI|nr:hypothetical protein L917_15150 [Phytophthora nicotianae]